MKCKTKLCKSDQDVRSPIKEIWLRWTIKSYLWGLWICSICSHKCVLYSCNLFMYIYSCFAFLWNCFFPGRLQFFMVISSGFLILFAAILCIFDLCLYSKHSLLGPFVVILLFNVVIFTLTLVILCLLFVFFVCFFSCHIFYNSCFYFWCQLVCLCSRLFSYINTYEFNVFIWETAFTILLNIS